MFMPSVRTFGGKKDMKSRAVLAFAENGLNLAVTSVMNLVNILGAVYAFPSVTTFCFSGAGGEGHSVVPNCTISRKGVCNCAPLQELSELLRSAGFLICPWSSCLFGGAHKIRAQGTHRYFQADQATVSRALLYR